MITLALVALARPAGSNWGDLSQTLTGRNGAHRFRITIECANFEPRGRRVSWVKSGLGYYPGINDRRTWVCDGAGPGEARHSPVDYLRKRTIEVRRFEVSVDGHRWRVPPSLTFDLLNLDLNSKTPNNAHGRAWLSKDGSRLALSQEGSDGGGGYRAYFTFHRSGRVERRIYLEDFVADRRSG